jgi:hypothetical protein
MKGYFLDEMADVVETYNEGMRQFFESGGCADVNYADVYNMTQRLGVDYPQEVSEQYRGIAVHYRHTGHKYTPLLYKSIVENLISISSVDILHQYLMRIFYECRLGFSNDV